MRPRRWIALLLWPLLLVTAGTAHAEVLLNVDYETGTFDSGIQGLYRAFAPAADATVVTTDAVRYGRYAVAHKVVLDDPQYELAGPRAESSTAVGSATTDQVGIKRSYAFSFLLKDWEDWDGTSAARDVIFQFKRNEGSPADAYFAVRANRLDFNWDAAGGATVLDDIRPYDNQWIDIRVDVEWQTDPTGSMVVGVRLPGQADYRTVVQTPKFASWGVARGGGTHAKIQWGDFRPNAKTANGDPRTRVVLHDDIMIATERIQPPLPGEPTCALAAPRRPLLRRGRRLRLAARLCADGTPVAVTLRRHGRVVRRWRRTTAAGRVQVRLPRRLAAGRYRLVLRTADRRTQRRVRIR